MSFPTALLPRLASSLLALGVAAVVVGCGSGETSTITVGNESDVSSVPHVKGETVASTPAATSTTSTAAVKTPAAGPLSKEPKVTIPKGPAPKALQIKELIKGTGPEAKAGDTVTVNYVGVLYKSGKEFDASWKRHEPFSFALGKGQVIKGWDQGVLGMKVGGRRELIIPSELAYGKAGRPPTIPPNAPLIFVVDLLKA